MASESARINFNGVADGVGLAGIGVLAGMIRSGIVCVIFGCCSAISTSIVEHRTVKNKKKARIKTMRFVLVF